MGKFNISKLDLYYDDFHALKNINLDIPEKEITAFIGPSGCGKSTLLKSLNRMNDLVEGCKITGEVTLDGVDIYKNMDVTLLRKRVGMVFQKPNPFPMSIYDNIAYGPRTHGIRNKAHLDDIVEKSLRDAAIWDEVKDRLKKSALGMSGGQQQRLCQIESQPNTEGYTENMRSYEPFAMPYIKITSANDAYDYVTKHVGANIPCRDIVDERIIEEVKTGIPYYDKKLAKDANGDLTGLSPKSMGEDGQFKYRRLPKDSYKIGIITDIRQMGGFPEYKGTPYVDTDGDGMPDEWEIANGLNPNDPSDANKDCTGDGYTNIEKYINGISTKHKVDWRDLKNNYDTLAEKGKLM